MNWLPVIKPGSVQLTLTTSHLELLNRACLTHLKEGPALDVDQIILLTNLLHSLIVAVQSQTMLPHSQLIELNSKLNGIEK